MEQEPVTSIGIKCVDRKRQLVYSLPMTSKMMRMSTTRPKPLLG